MNRHLVISCAISIWAGLPATILAQVSEGQQQQQSPSLAAPQQKHPDGYNRKRLPACLKLGVELRGRAESGNAFDSASSDGLYLNRLRLDIAVQPAPGVQFFLQGQDARAFGTGASH